MNELPEESVETLMEVANQPKYGWTLPACADLLRSLHQQQFGQAECDWHYDSAMALLVCRCHLALWSIPLFYSTLGSHRN